jgi:hypothetical protein
MTNPRTPDVAVRAREVEVARLTARKVPQAMIVSTLGISERQVRYDLANFRKRIAEAAGANKMLMEVYEELFRTAWQDHDKVPETGVKTITTTSKDGTTQVSQTVRPSTARAAYLRVMVEIADRLAALSGIDLKNLVPAAGGDTYVLGDATFDQRRLEVSDELANKIRRAGDGHNAGGG